MLSVPNYTSVIPVPLLSEFLFKILRLELQVDPVRALPHAQLRTITSGKPHQIEKKGHDSFPFPHDNLLNPDVLFG